MKKGQETRRYLLEIASRAIARHGIENLTTRLLAEEADVSTGLISRYFPKFGDLLGMVVAHIFSETNRILSEGSQDKLRGRERLLYGLKQNFRIFTLDKYHYNKCLYVSYVHIGLDNDITNLHHQVITGAIETASTLFMQLAEDEDVPMTKEEADAHAHSWMEQLEGALTHCCFRPKRKDREEFGAQYRERARRRLDEIVFLGHRKR